MSAVTIEVRGTPGPQGSKRHVGNGVMIESSEKVRPWREAIRWACIEKKARVTGPVSVDVVFTIQKPKGAPKRRVTFPDRKPDIDKLIRSTFDALVSVGAIEDDARVIRLASAKVYPGEDADALPVPGAVIRIRPIGGVE